MISPIYKAFIEAGREAGYPVTNDFNGAQQEGFGPYQRTIHKGERWSASFAYLRPIEGKRANLKVISTGLVTRVLIEGGKAVGAEFVEGKGGQTSSVRAEREVIVCAGAVQSPQLLQLSGIGEPAALKALGIDVKAASPNVGKNLQDHLDVCLIYEMTKPLSMYSLTKGLKQPMIGIEYMLTKQGLGRTNHLHAGAFLKTRGELDRPDIQLHLVNAQMRDHARIKADRDGFTIHACQLRPESKGTVTLASLNPFDAAAIDPRYLAEENDRRTMRDSVRIVRDIVKQHALDLYRGPEFAPGEHIRTDSEIDAWIRQNGETIYHPVGTVRMGADPKAPVDDQLRVRGVENLRVIDASVMPTLIGGNTNAPTIMIAEKISDLLRGKPFLPPQDAPIAEDERVAV
jgi:choline dehydrogenase